MTKVAVLGQGRQVGIRRPDYSYVCTDRVAAANALQLAVFDDPQDLLLHPQRDRRQFVEDQRAAVRSLEVSGVCLDCAGERTGLMAEQL